MGTIELGEALFGERWRTWSARRAKVVSAAELVVGERAKVVGTARALESTLVAPFTRRHALVCRTKLLEKHRREVARRLGDPRMGQDEIYWSTEIDEIAAIPFVVDCEDGPVLVDPRRVVPADGDESVRESPYVNDENPEFKAYLQRHGVLSTMYMGIAGEHEFLEAVIGPGQRIAVWGRVAETAGVETAGYRDTVARTKVIVGEDGDPCVLMRYP
jgi:hypothetical protein